MAVTNGWGKAVENNTIGYGKGANNSTNNWGAIYSSSAAGDTALSSASFSNQYSLDFNGVDMYAELGNVTSLNGSAVASWSLWVNRDDVTRNEVAISQSGAGTDRQFYLRFVGNNRIDLFLNNLIMFRDSSLNVTFANNTWYNIVLTYNGANTPNSAKCNLYINGVKETNTTGYNVSSLNSSSSNFNIGRHQNGASSYNNFFDGNIDEIALFDKELSQSEVTAIYNSNVPGDLTGHANLTDWWRCGDDNGGSGTTLTANVGGVNGSLYNSASYEENVPT
jgi:hypothetical protein|tara:strand:- start:82 stop:918 length:837 start_codon:yes stop_codon:yes gene_type:complete